MGPCARKPRMSALGLCISSISLLLNVQASGVGHWCYSSQDPTCGPDHWMAFSHNCGGENQSPVDIDRKKVSRDTNLGDIVFHGYDKAPPGKWTIKNDGHTVMASQEGETIMGDLSISGGGLPNVFRTLQFHFHWGNLIQGGSEHRIDGIQYSMELHIVHMNAKYKTITEAKKDPNGLAVLGVLFRVSETDNANYNTIVASMSNVSLEGQFVDLASTFRLDSLLPSMDKLSKYYRYQGSLTTPDCAEAVIWTVFEEPVNISRSQLNVFVDTAHFTATGEAPKKMTSNFRPPQPLNKRKISASRDARANCGVASCTGLLTVLLMCVIVQHMIHF